MDMAAMPGHDAKEKLVNRLDKGVRILQGVERLGVRHIE